VSETLTRIQVHLAAGNFAVSRHAYDKLSKRGILPLDVIAAMENAIVVEDYPDAGRGPSVLVLIDTPETGSVHAVWGIHNENPGVAVLVTAYKPTSDIWTKDFKTRLP
jgi:hypothetical protein